MDQEIRKQGIGGSEVSAILGLSEYSSPYKVWLSKTGRKSFNIDNKYTKAGLILESAVAEFFEQETRYHVVKASANQKTVIHPQYSFAVGTPDRRYVQRSKKGILECKTTQHSYDSIPYGWFIQLQWYLGIVGMKFGSVAWLERGVDFKYREYEYDPEFFDYMIQAVEKFWTENVIKDIPPNPVSSSDIELMFSRHREGAVMEATPEILSAYTELISVREAIKELERSETELTEMIKTVMRDNEIIQSSGKQLFTWLSPKPSQLFDRDRFQTEHPELYLQYMTEKSGSRRFLIKN